MRHIPRILLALLLGAAPVTGFGPAARAARAPQPPAAASPTASRSTLPLLLVHGFDDSCRAFTSTDTDDPGAGAVAAVDYLHDAGYSDVRTVGYYDRGDWSTSYHSHGNVFNYNDAAAEDGGDCFVNARTREQAHLSDCADAKDLTPIYQASTDDGIEHIACLFAWYLHDVNTGEGTPVDIVAHSMGGLVVRAALAFSVPGNTRGFPTAPLRVRRVVTVATPHLGLFGTFGATYAHNYPAGEVTQMLACPGLAGTCPVTVVDRGQGLKQTTVRTGYLIQALEAAGLPRGGANAYWALIGSSIPCTTQSPAIPSCANYYEPSALNPYTVGGGTYRFPDADGVVSSDSQMGMPADYKVMYGGFDAITNPDDKNPLDGVHVSPNGVVYSHEANSCLSLTDRDIPVGPVTIPTEFCLRSPYILNDGSADATLAYVCSTGCTGGFGDLNVLFSAPQVVSHSLAEIVSLLPPPPATADVVGHAEHAGNDYPWETIGLFDHQDQGVDPWWEYYGQCDSFAAWKAYENLYGAGAHPQPAVFPAPWWAPPSPGISTIDQRTWGNAGDWYRTAPAHGWAADGTPRPGAIAYWNNGHLGPVGHVAYVTDVYADGSITVENYNLLGNGQYSKFALPVGGGPITSFNRTITVPWPDGFAHIGDGPALNPAGIPLPPDPKPAGPVFGYPTHVKVVGPGSPGGQYRLTDVWYPQTGHGLLGTEQYTHTNGATAVSEATWAPSGLAGSTCYRVDALVPDNFSDNQVAVYTVTDATGDTLAAVNENAYTNDWAELGIFMTGTEGLLRVRLDDRGSIGGYVAADAVRFWQQPCDQYGTVAPILGPATSGTWRPSAGHGFAGAEMYSSTSGSTTAPGNTAAWVPASLAADACYEVFAYVPDTYSDNHAARYEVRDQRFGDFWPQIEENAFTNQFASLGVFRTGDDHSLPVTVTSIGPPGRFVAADDLAYTLDPGCANLGQPYNPRGQTALTIGPGSSPDAFTTTDYWYAGIGHGYARHDLWTHTNGAAPISTATYRANLAAGSCYQVTAWVPADFNANNPAAHYVVTSAGGGNGSYTVDQADIGDAWASVGRITTGTGTVTVTLDDTGPAGTFTAADAIRFTPC